MSRLDDRLARGQLRRPRGLDTEAVYRVCDWADAFVEVEVVVALGLQPAEWFRFTRRAVLAMEIVPAPNGPSEPSDPRG